MHQPATIWVDGDAIRNEREQAGLNRTELADLVGVTSRHIAHLENGTRRRMRRPSYIALRAALKTNDERLRRQPPRPTEADTPERK
jgi:transcriptional regulator with XRE-family HTH domain